MSSVAVSSGARVVGMDIPSPTSTTPTRSSSLREAPNSRRGLVFHNKEGMAQGGVADGRQGKRSRPRRSNSLNYHSKESGLDQPTSGNVAQYTIPSPTHQYPLRETVSLSQLQGGEYSRSGRQYGGVVSTGQSVRGSDLGSMPLKSSSMMALTPQHNMIMGHTHGSMETLASYPKEKVSEQGVILWASKLLICLISKCQL